MQQQAGTSQQQPAQPNQQQQKQPKSKMPKTPQQPRQQQNQPTIQKEATLADVITMLTKIESDINQLNQRVSILECRSPPQQPGKQKRDG